jgi:hypothetical protein
LRLLGFILMYISISMVLKIFSVLGDVIPFIGSIIAFGTSIISFMISFSLSLLVISVAWFFYRPLIGILLAIFAIGSFILLFLHKKKKS